MSAERDVNRIVRSWIRTEEHESSDRVLQTVLSKLDATPQRRPLWPSRRFADMNNYARFALGAAAVVLVVAFLGRNLLPRTEGVGGQPTVAPTASPTPSPTPPVPLASGTVHVNDRLYGRRIEIMLPTDWTMQADSDGQWAFARTGSAYPFVGVFAVSDVFSDPCAGTYVPLTQLAPPNATQLEDALTRLAGFEAGPVASVEVAGRPTRHFVLSNQIDTSTAACTDGDLLPLFWVRDNVKVSTNGGTTQQVWIVEGSPAMLIVGELGESPSLADQGLLDAIVASISG